MVSSCSIRRIHYTSSVGWTSECHFCWLVGKKYRSCTKYWNMANIWSCMIAVWDNNIGLLIFPFHQPPKRIFIKIKLILWIWWTSAGTVHNKFLEGGKTIMAVVYTWHLQKVSTAVLQKQTVLVNKNGVFLLYDYASRFTVTRLATQWKYRVYMLCFIHLTSWTLTYKIIPSMHRVLHIAYS